MTGPTPWQAAGIRTVTAGSSSTPTASEPVSEAQSPAQQPRSVQSSEPEAAPPGDTAASSVGRGQRVLSASAQLRERLGDHRDSALTLWGVVRRDWGLLFSAFISALTTYNVFQEWLIGDAPDGRISADAFGKLRISESFVALWSGAPPDQPYTTGKWGIIATAGAVVVVVAVVVNLWARTKVLAVVATGATIVEFVGVIVTLIYLNRVGEILRDRVENGFQLDLGTQVGMWIRGIIGTRNMPVPGMQDINYYTSSFTTAAVFTAVMTAASSTMVLVQWVFQYSSTGRGRFSFGRRRKEFTRRFREVRELAETGAESLEDAHDPYLGAPG